MRSFRHARSLGNPPFDVNIFKSYLVTSVCNVSSGGQRALPSPPQVILRLLHALIFPWLLLYKRAHCNDLAFYFFVRKGSPFQNFAFAAPVPVVRFNTSYKCSNILRVFMQDEQVIAELHGDVTGTLSFRTVQCRPLDPTQTKKVS